MERAISHTKQITAHKWLIFFCISINLFLFVKIPNSTAKNLALTTKQNIEKKETEKEKPHSKPPLIIDEYDRATPRSTLKAFIRATSKGDFKTAINFLDFIYLPRKIKKIPKTELARKLKIILDRALFLDLDSISDKPEGNLQDGLPPYMEIIGRVSTPKGGIDILLQKVPRKDGVKIWKFSNKTVAQIPYLYRFYGYRPLEKKISKFFPDVHFLGWQLWQWCAYFVLLLASYILIFIPTWLIAFLVKRKAQKGELYEKIGRFISGPIRILLWLFSGRIIAQILMPSAQIKALLHAGTLFILGACWAAIRALDIFFEFWTIRLKRNGQDSSTVLLKPLRTILRISIITIALLLWLDNMGFKVSALLAGLGVGGLAVALAAQGVLKNLLGTVMILADRPYSVGERIVVNGYDGEVEEIGLRSTSIRLLTGHQTTIPNDEIERTAVENIGRRPFIRRKQNLALSLDTPLDKVKKALEIIENILANHEGMKEEYPPRIYLDKFNRDSINIVFYFWYHPPEYWQYLDFCQRVNLKIMEAFEKEGIKLVPPASVSKISGDKEAEAIKIQEITN